LIDASPQLIARDARRFAFIAAGLLVLVAGVLLPYVRGTGLPAWPWIVAASLVAAAVAMPGVLVPPYRVVLRVTAAVGAVNNRLLLGLIFFGVFTPVALLRRLRRRDPLHRTFDATLTSYRTPADPALRSRLDDPY